MFRDFLQPTFIGDWVTTIESECLVFIYKFPVRPDTRAISCAISTRVNRIYWAFAYATAAGRREKSIQWAYMTQRRHNIVGVVEQGKPGSEINSSHKFETCARASSEAILLLRKSRPRDLRYYSLSNRLARLTGKKVYAYKRTHTCTRNATAVPRAVVDGPLWIGRKRASKKQAAIIEPREKGAETRSRKKKNDRGKLQACARIIKRRGTLSRKWRGASRERESRAAICSVERAR